MQADRPKSRRPSTWAAITIAAVAVLGGWGLMGGYIESTMGTKDETPVAAQAPAVPDSGWYRAGDHGKDITYMGRTFEVVGRPVTMPESEMIAAGHADEDVRLFFRNADAARAKVPATYPQSGRVGGAGEWNRDASENQGGGAGAAAYPEDKGPLFVKVGPGQYRMVRRAP